MANVWFTADFHLGHQNIIRYCERPFATVDQMNDAILDRLNDNVKDRDILYFLGDFCFGSGKHAAEYLRQIRCKNIHFIEGNHDAGARQIQPQFASWNKIAEVKINGQAIVLCHYAMRVWHQSFRGSWHFYGHSHGKLQEEPITLSMDVGVDTHNFAPWHFDEIKARMEEKQNARLAALGHRTDEPIADDECERAD